MSHLRFDFLNWRPDDEDYKNTGLITADNVLHSPEGYIEYQTPTTGAFATHPGLGTCGSVVFRPVGTSGQHIGAFLHNHTAAGAGFTFDMSIGLFASNHSLQGLYTTIAGTTVNSQYTGNAITAFEVAEYADLIFITAEAQGPVGTVINASGAPVVTLSAVGYMSI